MMCEEGVKNMITSNPEVLDGKPVVKGTRLSVEFIHGLSAAGLAGNGANGFWFGVSLNG